ncbi:MAG: serine protease [Planctomycetota bacterium]|nr:MAG: serine protease [Planctomycetota bacterium]
MRQASGGSMSAATAALVLIALCAAAGPAACPSASAASLHDAIREAQRKVVKIYGAGGVRGLEAYQSGLLISSEGHVLTVQSYVLDTEDLSVVLDDGRAGSVELIGVDPVRELALLKLNVEDRSLPHFNLAAAPAANVGDRVLAISNLFGIAAGDEPVSVLQGVVSAIAPLEARRGAFDASFRGNVYIVDAAANNPGAAGGALVNWQGELLGLLGKELRSRATGAWLHYAVPVDQFIGAVETMRSGRSVDERPIAGQAPADPLALADLGVVLVPDLLPRTPPYIDSVLPNSPAAAAGLRPDDLVAFVDGAPMASCAAVSAAVARREKFDAVRVSVLREGRLVETELRAAASGDSPSPADESSSDAAAAGDSAAAASESSPGAPPPGAAEERSTEDDP